MQSGKLTCQVTILRPAAAVDDGLQTVPGVPAPLAETPWAMRRDVSDGEVVRAGLMLGSKVSRFTLEGTAFARAIRVTDLIEAAGLTFDISGIKDVGDHDVEITAVARVDGAV